MFESVVYGIYSILCYGARTSRGAAGGIHLILSLRGGVFREFLALSEFLFIRIGKVGIGTYMLGTFVALSLGRNDWENPRSFHEVSHGG